MGGLDWWNLLPPKCPTQLLIWVEPVDIFKDLYYTGQAPTLIMVNPGVYGVFKSFST